MNDNDSDYSEHDSECSNEEDKAIEGDEAVEDKDDKEGDN